ncbi:MAG: 16S rRNA (uracil(1498)-N(3))-methyltransferase [Aquabacterium sp.]
MVPRFHVGSDVGFVREAVSALPEAAARHVQVLRMQPGAMLQVFDGQGQEWRAVVVEMGRRHVDVRMIEPVAAPSQELPVRITLAVGMPANDRMDALIEKATELGAHAIQPLMCERSVLRLDGERAAKKVAHWQAVAVSACEQSGRAVVPRVQGVQHLAAWLGMQSGAGGCEARTAHAVLSLRDAVSMQGWLRGRGEWPADVAGPSADEAATKGAVLAPLKRPAEITFLSGPEGGLSAAEEEAALKAGYAAVSLGKRVLRADTAPLAALSMLACIFEG